MSTLKTNNIQHVDAASPSISLDTGGNITVTGIITATSFSGSGANLTGIAATANVVTNSLVVSGVSTFAAGSASAPSISPTGDSNTGIFFPAADTIGFAEGGSEVARFDSSGRFGLNTSPAYALDVKQSNTGNSNTVAAKGGTNGGGFFWETNAGTTLGAIGYGDLISANSGSNNSVVTTWGSQDLILGTNRTERLRINSSGRLLVGTSSSRVYAGVTGGLQVESTGFDTSSLALGNNQNATNGAYLLFGKSRGTTVGSHTVVQNNDELGGIWFTGADGSALTRGAEIRAYVDGTPGVNDMPGRLIFSTTADGASAPTERMRIDNQGRLYHGQSSSFNPDIWNQTSGTGIFYRESGTGTTAFTINATTGYSVIYVNKFGYTGSNDGRLIDWSVNGSAKATISTNGTSVSYNTTSDYRLKTNVVQLTDAINRVKAFNPVRFNWVDPITPGTFDGFLAHEAAQVVPESVNGEKDAVNDDGTPRYQNIDHSKLVPLLTAALQESIARIESLESEVAALKGA